MELPKKVLDTLDELGRQLEAALATPVVEAGNLNAESEASQPRTGCRWMRRITEWWRAFKAKVASLWSTAKAAVKKVVKGIMDRIAAIPTKNKHDIIVVALLVATAIAVAIATVKSFALIIGLLAAFGLLALVRIVQRLQTILIP
jgi:hypothetical protein